MTKIRRDGFADEQAYIAYQQHLAKLEHEERMRQVRERQPKQKHPPAIARLLRLMKRRENNHKYYYTDIEKARQYNREWHNQDRAANPEKYRQWGRNYRARHLEQERLRYAVYYRDHHEEILARKKDNDRRYRASHAEEISAQHHAYYLEDREEKSVYNRTYRAKKTQDPMWREKANASSRDYKRRKRAEDRESFNAKRREYRARKRAEKQQREERAS